MMIGLSRPADAAALCHTQTQTITKRKHVSCKQAKKVVRASRRSIKRLPDCAGDTAKRWHGWKITASPSQWEGSRYKKGRRSFTIEGGGRC
jgi:hypothetical protein